jgi:hypothetical protein
LIGCLKASLEAESRTQNNNSKIPRNTDPITMVSIQIMSILAKTAEIVIKK